MEKTIVTICMFCKKVKTETGAWIESEVNPDVSLSHGLCKPCSRIHYPKYTKDE